MSPSPVSTAFSDSSSSTPTGFSNFSLRPFSEVRNEGVVVKATPVVVPPSSVLQDVLHSEHVNVLSQQHNLSLSETHSSVPT